MKRIKFLYLYVILTLQQENMNLKLLIRISNFLINRMIKQLHEQKGII